MGNSKHPIAALEGGEGESGHWDMLKTSQFLLFIYTFGEACVAGQKILIGLNPPKRKNGVFPFIHFSAGLFVHKDPGLDPEPADPGPRLSPCNNLPTQSSDSQGPAGGGCGSL